MDESGELTPQGQAFREMILKDVSGRAKIRVIDERGNLVDKEMPPLKAQAYLEKRLEALNKLLEWLRKRKI